MTPTRPTFIRMDAVSPKDTRKKFTVIVNVDDISFVTPFKRESGERDFGDPHAIVFLKSKSQIYALDPVEAFEAVLCGESGEGGSNAPTHHVSPSA